MKFGHVAAWAATGLVGALSAAAQYPGQITEKNPAVPEMRSVAVLEWTGDLAHPHASRLIPVSVYDGQQLQDGGIYLARPQPLALDSQTEYELQKDGKNIGFYDLHNAADQQGSWIGLGAFKPLPKGPSPQQLARAAARQKVDMDDADSDTPILHRKYHPDEPGSGSTESGGSTGGSSSGANGPTLHKGGDASSGSTASGGSSSGSSSGSGGGNSSSGPTLHKGGDASSDSGEDNAPAPDPDRPRLHDDDAADKPASDPDRPKLQSDPGNEVAHVSNLPDVSDPDRPRLRRGEPAEYGPTVKPTLMGLPPELGQNVAISDAQAVKEHPWDYTWANPGDEAKMKSDLEDMARKALGLDTPAPAAKAAPKKAAHQTSVHHKATPPPPPAPLLDEEFRVFELQYGAGATLVLSAHTAGTGADQKFVTIIAQPDLYGGVVPLLKSVTDAAHLDVTPRMRLIDAVDALADNRGELLFELRGQSQRQFAMYRVLRGEATKIFTSGSSYFGPQGE